jgi:hypothetical protein
MQSVPMRLGRWGIIKPFLLRVRADKVRDQARTSASVLPLPVTTRACLE